jgi:hypothetical protein
MVYPNFETKLLESWVFLEEPRLWKIIWRIFAITHADCAVRMERPYWIDFGVIFVSQTLEFGDYIEVLVIHPL